MAKVAKISAKISVDCAQVMRFKYVYSLNTVLFYKRNISFLYIDYQLVGLRKPIVTQPLQRDLHEN